MPEAIHNLRGDCFVVIASRYDIAFFMKSPSLQIGSLIFNWGSRTYVMGILNVTPDSFSGDGILSKEDAVNVAIE